MIGRAFLAAGCTAAVLVVAGCSDDEVNLENEPPPARVDTTTVPLSEAPAPPEDEAPPPAVRPQSSVEQLIQGWLAALEVSDYERAGSYFARDALIWQTTRSRLRSRAERTGFNRGLPCSAHLLGVRGKPPKVLATFLLSAGPGGTCNGNAYVRMTIRDGHIAVFHQLPDDPRRHSPTA